MCKIISPHQHTTEAKIQKVTTYIEVMRGQLLEVSAGSTESLEDDVVCSLTVQSDLVVLPHYHLFTDTQALNKRLIN